MKKTIVLELSEEQMSLLRSSLIELEMYTESEGYQILENPFFRDLKEKVCDQCTYDIVTYKPWEDK